MGIKLEIVLIFCIFILIIMTTMIKLTNTQSNSVLLNKEIEFKDTTFIQVDKKHMKANLFTTYGIRNDGVLHLTNLKYHTERIDSLVADKGIYKGKILFLDGNVQFNEKKGFVYTTQHANYNQHKEILKITSPFVAHMGKNIIYGNTLKYFFQKKELNATHVDALIYTVEK